MFDRVESCHLSTAVLEGKISRVVQAGPVWEVEISKKGEVESRDWIADKAAQREIDLPYGASSTSQRAKKTGGSKRKGGEYPWGKNDKPSIGSSERRGGDGHKRRHGGGTVTRRPYVVDITHYNTACRQCLQVCVFFHVRRPSCVRESLESQGLFPLSTAGLFDMALTSSFPEVQEVPCFSIQR